MGAEAHAHGASPSLDAVLVGVAAIAVVWYVGAAFASRAAGRPWPLVRIVLWCAGIAAVTASIIGPLAAAAHDSFVAHMWTHLLGGMLAPLLLVLAAPVTLALRALSVTPARRLSRMLRSGPSRIVAHPVTAAMLSSGGLWLIYLSPVYGAMQANSLAHMVVHAHLLLAGYLFTAAVIGLDPAPHAPGRILTAVVLVLAVASHGMLAKYLYAHPPASAPTADVHAGAELMYYAGAWTEAVVIVIFCAQWYRAAGRRDGHARLPRAPAPRPMAR